MPLEGSTQSVELQDLASVAMNNPVQTSWTCWTAVSHKSREGSSAYYVGGTIGIGGMEQHRRNAGHDGGHMCTDAVGHLSELARRPKTSSCTSLSFPSNEPPAAQLDVSLTADMRDTD